MSTIKVKLQNASAFTSNACWVTVKEIDSVQHKMSGKTVLLGENSHGTVFAVHSNISGESWHGNYISDDKAKELTPLFNANDFSSIYEQKDDLLS